MQSSTTSKQVKTNQRPKYYDLSSESSKKSNTKFSSGQKRSPRPAYDTLDSAYSTSESSYNTVDSSYSRQSASSGYDTFELRQKGISRTRQWNKDETRLNAVSNSSAISGSPSRDAKTGPCSEKIRFADDVDDSDTATETETDTEQRISVQSDDMSYVPDYIRPVTGPPNFTDAATVPNSRSPNTTTVLCPPSSTALPSSTQSKDFHETSSKPSAYNRLGRSGAYAGYRDDYMRKHKEKLCGRKSLDDRLKSLESGAAVKLQVCKGSQNRRKKSVEKLVTSNPQKQGEMPNPNSRTLLHNNAGETVNDAQITVTTPPPPPPDIIESHQPPVHVEQNSQNLNNPLSSDAPIQICQTDHLSKKLTSFDPATDDEPVFEPSRKNNFESEHSEIVLNCEPAVRTTSLWDLKPSNPAFKASKSKEKAKLEIDLIPSKNLPVSSSKTSKLKWRPPSQEALNKLHSSLQKLSSLSLTDVNRVPESSDIKNVDPNHEDLDDVVTPKAVEVDTQLDDDVTPLVVDASMRDTVVPVEMRSPRHDGESRSSMKGKRNARVFVFPQSDESETDNIVPPKDKPKHEHVAPVKFIPSVLRRRPSKSKEPNIEPPSATPAASLVANVKATISQEIRSSSDAQANKNSSTSHAKRQTSSKHSSRSKSTQERSSQEKSKHTRTLSTGSQSPTLDSASSAKKHSHETKSSTFTADSTYKSRGRKSRTEYTELSDLKRSSPYRLRKTSGPGLASPRQQAVAQAVIGMTGADGEFPYIDDTGATSTDHIKPPPADPRERSASDGALLRDARDLESSSTARRAFPLSRRGRPSKRCDAPRRSSYMEAMESSEDVTPDPDSESRSFARSVTSRKESVPLGMHGRSNSVDSVLSTTTDASAQAVVRRRDRAKSADRGSLKKSHRRSYQIATNKPVQPALIRQPSHRRQPSIRRLKSFFENNQSANELQAGEGRRRSRGRSLDPLPSLILSECAGDVAREGFLSFKVATIDKGRRTSSQKSWKSIWVVLKGNLLYLCKDWSRNKTEIISSDGGISVGLTPPGPNQTPPGPPVQLILEEPDPLNIQGSLVAIAYNYVKRKNVFKLTTGNGSEYLFQADDRDDMLAWISAIQMRSCHDDNGEEVLINKDLILRKSSQIEMGPKPEKRANRKSRSPKPMRRPGVTVKDVDGSRRFKWRGSVNRIVKKFGQGQVMIPGGTFEVHLEDCPTSINNELVPFVVDLCCRIVEERGLDFTGIYRVPGNSGTLATLQEELNNRGPDAIDFENDPRLCELNVVSSLLKSFFRKLPDPLFTNELYDDFIAINRKKDSEERLNGLRRLIHMLPAPHYETLKFLIAHLRKVSDHSETNKMEIRNLAIVFGPTLVRSSVSDNMATMVTDMSDQCRIVESVLQHADWFFSDDKKEGSVLPLPPAPKEEHHEPVPSIDHLLANVGRTHGDASDNASDSSKSKTSLASEKDSFSRDVLDLIFGAGKRLLQPPRGAKDNDTEDSSGDEYGFKKSETNSVQTSIPSVVSSVKTSPSSNPAPRKYQVAKPAASGIRAAWPDKVRPTPSDISARLYSYYLDNIDRAKQNTQAKVPPAESHPMPTPHFTVHSVQRSYAMKTRRLSETGVSQDPPAGSKERTRLYKSSEDVQSSSHKLHKNPDPNPSDPADRDSDSDTSVYVGETLEEKLKNLTNLDKKLERRPSRRNRPNVNVKLTPSNPVPPKVCNKRLTAPSMLAGKLVTPDNLHLHSNKKTTHELYRERKARKQQHRETMRARRHETSDVIDRTTSVENVAFNRSDPKRQLLLKPADQHELVRTRRSRSSGEKVQRRHTLGGNDFPTQDELCNNDQYASLQNIDKFDRNSAIARLKPNLSKSVPLQQSLPVHLHPISSPNNPKKSDTIKVESYI